MKYMLKASSPNYRHYGRTKFELVNKEGRMDNLTYMKDGDKSGVCISLDELIMIDMSMLFNEEEVDIIKIVIKDYYHMLKDVPASEDFLNKLSPLAKKLGVKNEH